MVLPGGAVARLVQEGGRFKLNNASHSFVKLAGHEELANELAHLR